jgi:DNA-binding NarL/FixJ family response regulator
VNAEPTVAERETLAQTYAVSTAPWLAFAVHQRDADQIAELLQPLGVQELRALAVVLASQLPRPRTRPDDGVIDEVAVQRAAAGEEMSLSKPEKAAAAQLMASRGLNQSEIARRLHTSHTTIHHLLKGAAA